MRKKTIIKNSLTTILVQLVSIICSLVIKKILLDFFSLELIGINSLVDTFYTSILFLDLGLTSMLTVSLMKAINIGDDKGAFYTLSIYKTIFFFLSMIIGLIGVITLINFDYLFNVSSEHLRVMYIIFTVQLIEVMIKYLLMYKTNILIIYQKKYLSDLILIIVNLFSFCFKVYTIIKLNNFILFSVISIFTPLIHYFFSIVYINNKHSYLRNIPYADMKSVQKSNVLKNTLLYLPNAIHGVVYYSMDNMLISKLFSLKTIGLLSNYNMVYGTINIFIIQLSNAIQSTIANHMYVENDKQKDYKILEILNIINVLIVSIIVSGFILMSDNFITLLFGSEYVIDRTIVVILACILGLNSYFRFYENIHFIKGLMLKEKWSLILSASLNIILSIYLGKKIGLEGVFLATFISTIVLRYGRISLVIKSEHCEIHSVAIRNIMNNLLFIAMNVTVTNILFSLFSLPQDTIIHFIINVVFICTVNVSLFILIGYNNMYFKELKKLLFKNNK